MPKLIDLCDIQYGYAFDSNCFSADKSHIPLVRIRDVKRGYSETYYTGAYTEEYVVHANDLLVGMDGEFNIARWKSEDSLLNQRVCKISAKELVDEEYLRFVLSKKLKEIEQRTSFVTVKHLSAKELNRIELNIPNILEQQKIANKLVGLEKIIEKRKEEIKWLDSLAKARFVEMFGDLMINDKQWVRLKISKICTEIVDCINKTAPTVEYETGYKMLRTTNVKNGEVDTSDVKYVEQKVFDKWTRRSTPQNGDVLLTREAPMGQVGLLYGVKNDVFLGQRLVSYRCDLTKMDSIFLTYQMMSGYFQDQIEKTGKGSTVKHIPVPDCTEFEVFVPPIVKQKEFATFVHRVNKSKVAVQKALDEVQLLFDSLMQAYFG